MVSQGGFLIHRGGGPGGPDVNSTGTLYGFPGLSRPGTDASVCAVGERRREGQCPRSGRQGYGLFAMEKAQAMLREMRHMCRG